MLLGINYNLEQIKRNIIDMTATDNSLVIKMTDNRLVTIGINIYEDIDLIVFEYLLIAFSLWWVMIQICRKYV